MLKLYLSLVRPRLEYACPMWSPHTVTLIAKLSWFRNLIALKIVSGSGILATLFTYI